MSDLADYIQKLEQGLRAVLQQERDAQDAVQAARDARLRQEGALLAMRELAQMVDTQEVDDGALH